MAKSIWEVNGRFEVVDGRHGRNDCISGGSNSVLGGVENVLVFLHVLWNHELRLERRAGFVSIWCFEESRQIEGSYLSGAFYRSVGVGVVDWSTALTVDRQKNCHWGRYIMAMFAGTKPYRCNG
jgi:hypothetical protein